MRILWHGLRVRPGREHHRGASTGSARTAVWALRHPQRERLARALRHAQRELRQGNCDRFGANGGKGAATGSARTAVLALRQVQREWKGRERGSAPPQARVPSFPRKRESIFSANACPIPRYRAGIHLYDFRTGPERRAGDKPPRYQDDDTLANIEAVNGAPHRRKQDFRHSRESLPRTPIGGGNPSLRFPHRPRTPLQRH